MLINLYTKMIFCAVKAYERLLSAIFSCLQNNKSKRDDTQCIKIID